jgi:hypothetical protein
MASSDEPVDDGESFDAVESFDDVESFDAGESLDAVESVDENESCAGAAGPFDGAVSLFTCGSCIGWVM